MASVRRNLRSDPMLDTANMEFLLAPKWTHHWPKLDPSLAKTEPISDAGGVSMITYLRNGKKCCTDVARERGEKNKSETAL